MSDSDTSRNREAKGPQMFLIKLCILFVHLLVHVLQASEDHHTVGQTALHQEVEGIPVKRKTF